MMTMRYAAVAVLFLGISTLFGCDGRPGGFPATYPTTVTVMNGESPLADVTVFLDPATPGEYLVSGMTDVTGVAKINTKQEAFQNDGAPAGTFKVRVEQKSKPLPANLDSVDAAGLSPDEAAKHADKVTQFMAQNRLFPDRYTSPSQTPVSITVTETGGEVKFNIAE